MSMLLRVLSYFGFLLLVVPNFAVADEICSACGDKGPAPGRYDVAFKNVCSKTVFLAVHYAPYGVLVTEGWWSLEPREKVGFQSNTEVIGWYATSGPNVWDGVGKANIHLAIHRTKKFQFEGFDPPRNLEPVLFIAERLVPKKTVTIEIECGHD